MGAAAGYVGFSWLAARKLLRPPRLVCDWHPGVLGLRHEDAEHIARDGGRLRGWIIHPSQGEPLATVLVLHGFTRSRWDDKYMCPSMFMLASAGFRVAAFDLRGHGESGGRSSLGLREAEDAEELVRMLRERFGGRLGVLGFSLGGAVALMLAARGSVDAVVADSPYVDILESARGWVKRAGTPLRQLLLASFPLIVRFASLELGFEPSKLVLHPLAPRIRIPTLIIAGRRDDLVPLSSIERFHRAAVEAGAPVELWVTGSGHVESLKDDPVGYRERVTGFFERWLAGEA